MKLLIVRHADPNYAIDSLTEQGWKEAQALAERLAKEKIDYFYVSPLGRAQDTASVTLHKMNRTAETKEWLREFHVHMKRPDRNVYQNFCWDWLPKDWTTRPGFYDKDHWFDEPEMKEGQAKEEYIHVTSAFDELLKEHGYQRDGNLYKAIQSNHDTICIFSHFGCGAVLLSHLIGVSPMVFWQGFCAAPSSVTTVHTEERREGTACFRIAEYASTEHLYAKGMKPSFSARFAECYQDPEIHDESV